MSAVTCQAQELAWGLRLDCRNPAVATVTAGCLHEHVRSRVLCADHTSRESEGICLICDEIDGHECRIKHNSVVPFDESFVGGAW